MATRKRKFAIPTAPAKSENGGGRPTVYSDEMADLICTRLGDGESLSQICRDDFIPDRRTIVRWAIQDINGFNGKYTAARDIALDIMADEVLEIADNPHFVTEESVGPNGATITKTESYQHRRLRFDARRWYLSKLAPKRYGDKLETTHRGDAEAPIVISQSDAKL